MLKQVQHDMLYLGMKKMELRVGLALCVMLAMAVGRIKEDRRGLMRSLLKSPVMLDKAA